MVNKTFECAVKLVQKNLNMAKAQSIFLNLTYKCPLKCSYCYIEREGARDMTVEEADYAVNELVAKPRRNYARLVTFFGGEPALRIDIIQEILKKYYDCRDHFTGAPKTRFGIITSFSVNRDKIIELAEQYPRFEIVISYDKPQNNERIVTNTGQAIDLDSAIDFAKIEKHNRSIQILKMIGGHDQSLADELIQLFEINRQYGFCYDWSHNKTQFDDVDYEKITEQYYIFLKHLAEATISGLTNYLPRTFCDELRTFAAKDYNNTGGCGIAQEIFLSSDGAVFPCAISNRNTGLDLKNPSIFLALDEYEKQYLGNATCRECDTRYFCNGGCLANRHIRNNDYTKPDRLWCSYIKAIEKSYEILFKTLNKDKVKTLLNKAAAWQIAYYRYCCSTESLKDILK